MKPERVVTEDMLYDNSRWDKWPTITYTIIILSGTSWNSVAERADKLEQSILEYAKDSYNNFVKTIKSQVPSSTDRTYTLE